MPAVVERTVTLTGHDQYLFREGTHSRLYEKLGAHFLEAGGNSETYFAVWAPNAQSASVVGDWNGWAPRPNPRHGSDSGTRHARAPQREAGACDNDLIAPVEATYQTD